MTASFSSQSHSADSAGQPHLVPPMLDISHVSLSFGGLMAVADLTMSLPQGILHGLIGPNGAGKTTVFNLITGIYKPDQGKIALAGRVLNGMKPNQIAGAGIARTFQNIRLFPELTVLDNVRLAMHLRVRHTMASALLRLPRHMAEERDILARSLALLKIFSLQNVAREQASSLPYGDRRRLEIARALATDPKVLLLDEPAAGMHTGEKAELRDLIRFVRDKFSVTILLIEHDMGLVMDICDRITVLDHGQVICEGTPHEVQDDPKVIEAYLGTPTELPSLEDEAVQPDAGEDVNDGESGGV